MEGGETPESAGMIPRAVSQVFSSAQLLKGKGWTYTFKASFMEVTASSLVLLSTKQANVNMLGVYCALLTRVVLFLVLVSVHHEVANTCVPSR